MVNIQAMAMVNEGLTLLALNQHEMARKVLHEALAICDRWTENLDQRYSLLCELHHGLTRIYVLEGKLEHAWESAQYTLQFAERALQKMHLGLVYRDFGDILTRIKSAPANSLFAEPDEYFQRSLEVFRELNMEAEMARTIYAQALSMAQRGRKTTAARKLQQVMIMFTTLGMVDDAAKAAEAQLTVI
jgi:tetratricopeptide (TPR) repeat protein